MSLQELFLNKKVDFFFEFVMLAVDWRNQRLLVEQPCLLYLLNRTGVP